MTDPTRTTDGSETVTVASTVSPARAKASLQSLGAPLPASMDRDLTTPASPEGTRTTFVPACIAPWWTLPEITTFLEPFADASDTESRSGASTSLIGG